MAKLLKNKVVLITGASSGIGEATALRLQQIGCIVYAAARRTERMERLKECGIHVLRLDITNDNDIINVVEQIKKEQGKIDILVNGAGYGSYGALEDVPLSEGKNQFEVNLFGLARLTQLVLPCMRENRYGKIINISSIGGKIHEPFGVWYHASKYALEGLSDCLRMEVKDFGIDVIVIQPGGIKTEWGSIMSDNLLKYSGNSEYSELFNGYIKSYEKIGNSLNNSGSEPIIIAKLIEKAINAKRPKTRYSAGFGAKPILFFRKLLSDKMYDKIWAKMMKNMAKKNNVK